MRLNKQTYVLLFNLALIALLSSCDDARDTRFGAKTYMPADYTGTLVSCKTTPDGGTIAAGEATTIVAEEWGVPTALNTDVWVTKLDATGGIQWERSFGGAGWDGSIAKLTVAVADDGGYTVFAMSETFGLYWVLKLDARGAITWQKAYQTAETPYGEVTDMQKTADGGYILAGSVGLVKITATGSIQWAKKYFQETKESSIQSIRPIRTGGYIVAGTVSTNAEPGIPTIGYQDGYIMELNPDGSVRWVRHYGVPERHASFTSIAVRDDGYLVSGSLAPMIDLETWNDCWIIKTDAEGALQWQRKYDSGGKRDALYWIENTTDNGFVVAGEFGDWENKRMFAMKFDGTGSLLWQKGYDFDMFFDGCLEMHEDTLGFVVCTRMSDEKLGGLMLRVNKNGDAPGAPFMKKAAMTMTQTNAQAQQGAVQPVDAAWTVVVSTVVPRATKAKVVTY